MVSPPGGAGNRGGETAQAVPKHDPMHHGPDLMLATLVACILLAFLLGLVARALKLPALIGYIAAGIIIGPYTPGLMAERGMVNAMAEVGVALLLFAVGLHFRAADLLAVWRVAVPGAVLQISLAALLGAAVGAGLLGLSFGAAIAFGLALAISSTAVATKALEERGRLGGQAGRIALGWLVMQDLVVVFALVMLPAVAGGAAAGGMPYEIGKAALSLVAFAALMMLFGRRALPWLLVRVARSGSRELFTLAVLAGALGVAFLASALFGVSFALGAFFAGVVLGESSVGHQAAAEATPLQRIFSAIFFVSVGMLLDPGVAAERPLAAGGAILSVLLAVAGGTLALLLLLKVPPTVAVTVAGALGQIGEFSFLLVELAVREHLVPEAVRGPVLVAAAATILLTPLTLRVMEALGPRLERSAWLERWRGEPRKRPAEAPEAWPLVEGHAIVVGTGRVGSLVIRALQRHHLPVIAIEEDRAAAERLDAEGTPVVWGDATRLEVLSAAVPERAALLIIALPNAVAAHAVLDLAREINPEIHVLVRTHSEDEALLLEAAGVGLVMMGEKEIALGMADHAMQRLGVPTQTAQATVDTLRRR